MNVLFPTNFGSGVGYAWNTIEAVLLQLGERLAASGHTAFIGYPSLDGGEPAWAGHSPVRLGEVDFWAARRPAGLLKLLRFLRRHHIDTVYLTDRPTWSWLYPVVRAAGVRAIVVHERTSGVRKSRTGALLQGIKRALHRNRWLAADAFVAVSDYVGHRMVTVNGTPRERTFTVYNGIPAERFESTDPGALRRLLGVAPAACVIWASGRLQPYKGFHVLIEAVARVRARGHPDVVLALCGHGPQLPELREQARALGADVRFLGRRDDVGRLLGDASIAVVPSLWEEAFGLAVVEAMAAGVPVVASRTGGIPELVEDGRSGLLVPAGDAEALADALARLVADPEERTRLGANGRTRARTQFSIDRTVAGLHRVLLAQLELPASAAVPLVAGGTHT